MRSLNFIAGFASLGLAMPETGGKSAIDPCTQQIVRNPGFETGNRAPWIIANGSVPGLVVTPGSTADGDNSTYCLASGGLVNNNLFTVQQVLTTCPNTPYSCTFDYRFEAYYATTYPNGNTYVPYVHVYINYQPGQGNTGAVGVDSLHRGEARQWLRSTFQFVGSGNDTLEFDIASPESQKAGCNYMRLDNVYCYPNT